MKEQIKVSCFHDTLFYSHTPSVKETCLLLETIIFHFQPKVFPNFLYANVNSSEQQQQQQRCIEKVDRRTDSVFVIS